MPTYNGRSIWTLVFFIETATRFSLIMTEVPKFGFCTSFCSFFGSVTNLTFLCFLLFSNVLPKIALFISLKKSFWNVDVAAALLLVFDSMYGFSQHDCENFKAL